MFDQDTFPIWEVIKWSLTWVSQKIKGLLICVAKVLCNIPCSCAVKKKSRLLVQHERLGYALKFIWKWCQTNYRKIIILSCQTGPLVGYISTKYIGKCVAHGNQNAPLLLCVILCATSSLISAGDSSKGIDVSCILCEMIAWKDVIPSFQWRFSLPENEMGKKNTFCVLNGVVFLCPTWEKACGEAFLLFPSLIFLNQGVESKDTHHIKFLSSFSLRSYISSIFHAACSPQAPFTGLFQKQNLMTFVFHALEVGFRRACLV